MNSPLMANLTKATTIIHIYITPVRKDVVTIIAC
jgi:hypothetical protein